MNLKEKVMEIVSKKGMYSCMNNTKWRELQSAVYDLPFLPPYVLKKVCEEETEQHKFDEDVWYLGDWSNETEEFLSVLKKINLPIEEQNGTYIIYGYSNE